MSECRCGKVGYASERQARHDIKKVEQKTGIRHQMYACPTVPKLWHLTAKRK